MPENIAFFFSWAINKQINSDKEWFLEIEIITHFKIKTHLCE